MTDRVDPAVSPQLALLTAQKMKSAGGDLSVAQQQRDKIRQKINEAKEADRRDRAKLVTRLMELDGQFSELAADKKALAAKCNTLEAELESLREGEVEKTGALEEELSSLKNKVSRLSLENRELTSTLQGVETLNAKYKKDLEDANKTRTDDSAALKEAERERDEWKEAFLEVQEAVSELFQEPGEAEDAKS